MRESGRARGLLARIGSPPGGPRQADEGQSVIEHLRVLLNSRQGESAAVPDFGVGDIADIVIDPKQGPERLRDELRKTIERFEPRLRNVRVQHVKHDDGPMLRFEIMGELASTPGKALKLRTDLMPSGEMLLR